MHIITEGTLKCSHLASKRSHLPPHPRASTLHSRGCTTTDLWRLSHFGHGRLDCLDKPSCWEQRLKSWKCIILKISLKLLGSNQSSEELQGQDSGQRETRATSLIFDSTFILKVPAFCRSTDKMAAKISRAFCSFLQQWGKISTQGSNCQDLQLGPSRAVP